MHLNIPILQVRGILSLFLMYCPFDTRVFPNVGLDEISANTSDQRLSLSTYWNATTQFKMKRF